MKPDRTTIEGNLAVCDLGDTERKRRMESGEDNRNYAPLEPPTQTELHCREHKQARFEKMLKQVYGFFRRKT